MKFYVMTLFPYMFETVKTGSILGKAVEKGLLSIECVDIREYTLEKHGKVDDYTYGGGAGLLMQAQPIYDCYMSIRERLIDPDNTPVIYLSPQGRLFDQQTAREMAEYRELVLLCGHYEGVDERVIEEIVTQEISIGDYVLTGGELPSMVMIDAVSRLVPGVLHNDTSADSESFENGLLEYPQYSRPEVWNGRRVPPILLSGDHAKVDQYRLDMSIERTRERRPDLYAAYMEEQARLEALSPKKKKRKKSE